ncbi:hypothetical protein DI09_12p220 [Mitosporidium daphniae]|uniref:Uncharacterized protein n=1 Tax=Mitosporidium daphniae TaxID=1485682 RepID=A0A098VVJ0_9MICR|nr:uncharacterized protein DI09_12p220 [Mitosporidium daphniae]KGG52854.1 hypothetical protein DI09_12p220 [Mitosporidium daphniae]|eukprot:XP_013239281.1 uncharacterized protein DI09_12p220 [Mitosporidium daphniae]
MSLDVLVLGAGQDVGKSCIVVRVDNKYTLMFDCGIHMKYTDSRRFPDFSLLSKHSLKIDFLFISHFHLDHCGALPYFTEKLGYAVPRPTKAIAPLLLEDCRKLIEKDEEHSYSSEMIWNCINKVIVLNLNETLPLAEDLYVRTYYAGHVLGAVMFHIHTGTSSVVYTGDFNSIADRHLGAAFIDRLHPDLMITESTYSTLLRDTRRSRERDFLFKIHQALNRGGKVLIPVFALGRAQELCLVVESYWERMGLQSIPVFFNAGLTERANAIYRIFPEWMQSEGMGNPFDFKFIRPFDMQFAELEGPMLLFASPGSLQSGASYEVFKKWASDERNLVLLPGYAQPGSIAAQLLSGSKLVALWWPSCIQLSVNIQVQNLSFSLHADGKGILSLIKQCQPSRVMLVHGGRNGMYATCSYFFQQGNFAKANRVGAQYSNDISTNRFLHGHHHRFIFALRCQYIATCISVCCR